MSFFEFESEDIISDDDDDDDEPFESVFTRLPTKKGGELKETMNYAWLIDILPDELLDMYRLKRFGKIKDWLEIRKQFNCHEVKKYGFLKKLFLACLCKNINKRYFVSYTKLGKIKSYFGLWVHEIDENFPGLMIKKTTWNRFIFAIKEILISLKLSILHNKVGLFPVCTNFVKTFYASRRIVNSNVGYITIQEQLDMTLFEYIKELIKGLNNLNEYDEMQRKYNEHVVLFKKYSDKQDDPTTPDELLPKLENKKDEQEKLMKKIKYKMDEIEHNYTHEKVMLCYLQVIYALYAAEKVYKEFIHGDFHPANVMIKKIKDKDFDGFVIIVNKNLIFKLPKWFNLRAVIIDFNRSYIRKQMDYKDVDNQNVMDLFTDFFETLFGHYFDENSSIVKMKTVYEKLNPKKRYDLKRLHYGILLKKYKPGVMEYLKLRPNKLFDKFKDENLMMSEDFYLNLLKDPVFKKYRVKKIDRSKLNPKYTVEFNVPKNLVVDMNPNYVFC
jgi:putative sterol carrier protein